MHQFTIAYINKPTQDTYEYGLKPLGDFTYKAGQFLNFVLNISGKIVRRPYSIATVPQIDEIIKVVIKRIPNGEASRFIQDTWAVGDVVESLEASGKFVQVASKDKPIDLFFLAAGSGITPIMGLLKEALYLYPETHIKLYYSNKNVSQTIFYDELNALNAQFSDRLKIEYFFSESKYLQKARLSKALLSEYVNRDLLFNPEDALFYTCGPFDYMLLCQITLKAMGFEAGNIKREVFVVPEDEGDDDDENAGQVKLIHMEDKSPRLVQISLQGKSYDLIVNYPDSILAAAEKAGIDLPFSCHAGRCSACLATCKSGEVVMSYNQVLTDNDEKKGLILTCTGHPVSKKVVLVYE
jgi:ring-1,2-phenylacetyl-CoA epoxidase subunit PaaE